MDHPLSKKTKISRSRRRRKGRRTDPATAVNEGGTCEFVRGGGGKPHSSSGLRRDWFSGEPGSKQNSFDSDVHDSISAFGRENKERRDGLDRKKATPQPTVDGATRSAKSAGAVTSRGKEPKNHQSAKVSDSSQLAQGSKSSVSKELPGGDKRQLAAPKNNMSAASSDSSSSVKVQSTQLESGWSCCRCYVSSDIELLTSIFTGVTLSEFVAALICSWIPVSGMFNRETLFAVHVLRI